MADEPVFDITMKKKKKKTAFVLDPEIEEKSYNEYEDVEETKPEKIALEDITSLSKKKKKKKKPFNLSELEESLPSTDEPTPVADYETVESGDATITPFDLTSLPMKKKKKKKAAFIEEQSQDATDDVDGSKNEVVGTVWQQSSELDYTYDELLCRAIEIMREANPDMVAGQKRRFVMKPPHVLRVGTKKSSFSNFAEICKLLHRQPKHLHQFLMSELGTSGSIDGNNQLIIKGRFQQKQIESVLRRYIKEYVTCHTCRSPETILQKDTRLYFLQCETCGSRCSVVGIKSGFQAVTGKRAAIRARTT